MSIDDSLKARLWDYMESISTSGEGRLITFDGDHISALFNIDHPGRNPVGCLHVYDKRKTIVAVAEFAFTTKTEINVLKVQSMIPARYRISIIKGASENRVLARKKIIIKDRNQLEQRLDELIEIVVQVTRDIAFEFNNKDMRWIKSQTELGLKPNLFEALLEDDFEVGVKTALMKYGFSDREQEFLEVFFSAVRSMIVGKAIPYSYEIGSKYDYADAAVRYACEYIVNLGKMYADIEEYASWFLKDRRMQVLKCPPSNSIALLYFFLKSEYYLVAAYEIEDDTISEIKIEAFQYLSDPAREYIKRKILSLESYVRALGLPNDNSHYTSVETNFGDHN